MASAGESIRSVKSMVAGQSKSRDARRRATIRATLVAVGLHAFCFTCAGDGYVSELGIRSATTTGFPVSQFANLLADPDGTAVLVIAFILGSGWWAFIAAVSTRIWFASACYTEDELRRRQERRTSQAEAGECYDEA